MLGKFTAVLIATSFSVLTSSASLAANLTGAVRDQSGASIPQTIALLQSHADPDRRYVLRTDEGGVFRFLDIAEGVYTLELLRAGFKSKLINSVAVNTGAGTVQRTFVLEVGEVSVSCERLTTPLLDIRLVPSGGHTGSLTGKVVDTRTRPRSGVTVVLVCADGQPCGKAKTDSRGEFKFLRLALRTYSIKISRHGFYPSSSPGLSLRENLEMIYYPTVLEQCPKGNCDPRFRPNPKTVSPVLCL